MLQTRYAAVNTLRRQRSGLSGKSLNKLRSHTRLASVFLELEPSTSYGDGHKTGDHALATSLCAGHRHHPFPVDQSIDTDIHTAMYPLRFVIRYWHVPWGLRANVARAAIPISGQRFRVVGSDNVLT